MARVNKALPPRMRLLGYTRVTGGFDARRACDKRRSASIIQLHKCSNHATSLEHQCCMLIMVL